MLNDNPRDDFAILFLTHGRADSICTVDTVQRCGYTGKYYIVIDDEDDQEPLYRAKFGDKVIKFCKSEIDSWTDRGDNRIEDKRAILWARNASFEIARNLGLTYFMMLEDDQADMQIRLTDEDASVLSGRSIRHFNAWINIGIEFLEATKAKTVAFAQGGDTIGGINGGNSIKLLKFKTMNSFICKADNPIVFRGRFNEDCTDYVTGWMRGIRHFSIMGLQVQQKATATIGGGMTEAYKENGTYAKTVMSIMYAPSAVKCSYLHGLTSARVHHNVKWGNCVPKIIRYDYCK